MSSEVNAAGRTSRLIAPLVIAAIAAAVWATFFYANFSHLWAPDAMKFAQAARNFLEGGGFDRDEVWPMSLASGGELNEETQAVLHPLAVAALFKVVGRSDRVVALAGGVFFILAAPLVYFIGRSVFGTTVGVLATVLYLGDRSTLYYSISGLSESLFTFLLLVLFAALIYPGERGGLRRYALSGAALGLCYLARPVALAFIPAVLVYAYFDAGRNLRPGGRVLRAAALMFGAVCVVVIVLAAFGVLSEVGSERNSFHLISNTPDYPGHSYVRSVTAVSFWDHFTAHPEAHIKKWLHQLGVMSRGFFQGFADPLIVVLFVAFPLVFGERGGPLRLFLLAAALVVLQGGLAALTMPATRYLHPFVPLGMVFASASLTVGVRRLMPERPGLRAAVIAAAALVALHPFVLTAPLDRDGVISAGFSEIHGAKDFTSLGAFVQEHTGEDDVILSDAPWIVSWYGDRTSIWLPNSPRDVAYLRTHADIEWLFLTEEYPLPRAWRLLFEGIAAGHESPDWEFVIGVEDDRTLGHLFRARRD